MKQPHVVVIGSGFGGVYTVRHLKPLIMAGKVDVTIINPINYFLFTPLLHEVATGGLSPTSVVEPIREVFRHSNIRFIQDEVKHIDSEKKEVSTTKKTIYYDYLVVSSGAETNYYGVPGAEQNTFSLKNLNDAMAIRRQIIDVCEKGALEHDDSKKRKMLSCVVVGAGATGVELASEIIELMHSTLCSYYHLCGIVQSHMNIHLVAASPDVLPQFPMKLREIAHRELLIKGVQVTTNVQVTGVEPGKIIFKDGTFLEADTLIWVAGVKPKALEIAGAEKEKSGRIKVDEFLRVVSTPPFSNIFSLGDVAGASPMLAQVAVQQGKVVARNIIALIENKPLTAFIFKEKGLLVSLGQWYAAGRIYGITMKGPFMWLIWRGVYLFNFLSWRKRVRIAAEWTINFFYPRDITRI